MGERQRSWEHSFACAWHDGEPCTCKDAMRELLAECGRLREQLDAARADLKRAAYLAEHLWQMIDPETWRATGGDDGQGHYEGDYHAEQTRIEIQELAARAALGVEAAVREQEA